MVLSHGVILWVSQSSPCSEVPPASSSSVYPLQTNAPSCSLGFQGSDWPSAETRIWDAEPELRLWLCFRPIPSQPKGNCCHVPGLTLQFHLPSAEQHSGFGSKRLLDLTEAPLRNLLTSEMLSYGGRSYGKILPNVYNFFCTSFEVSCPSNLWALRWVVSFTF